MALKFTYDADRRLLLGHASGVLTRADIDDSELPTVPIGTPELFDFREVAAVELTTSDIRQVADNERTSPSQISRMAMLTSREVVFGLSRMFQAFADQAPYEIEVFRDVDEALAWLEAGRTEPA